MTSEKPWNPCSQSAASPNGNIPPEAAADTEPFLPMQVDQQQEEDPQQETRRKQRASTLNILAGIITVLTCPIWGGCIVFLFLKHRFFPKESTDEDSKTRVKSIASHPSASCVIVALYSGDVLIWNTREQEDDNDDDDEESGHGGHGSVATKDIHPTPCRISVSRTPVRCVKFVERMNCIVTASDDGKIRFFDFATREQTAELEGTHEDYIRYLEVHPQLPYLLSCSDDATVKCWDMEYNFSRKFVVQDAHDHYVMQVKVNPHDPDLFATAGLDRAVKIWKLGQVGYPLVTLRGHEHGVNCIDFCPRDKRYLVSGSDDETVKVWDLEMKTVVQTLDGHAHNVNFVLYHPVLPILVSASEDERCRIWETSDGGKYQEIMKLNPELKRLWALSFSTTTDSQITIGGDEGCACMDLDLSRGVAKSMMKVERKRMLPLADDNSLADEVERRL